MFSASKHDLAEGERDIVDHGENNGMGTRLLTLHVCPLP